MHNSLPRTIDYIEMETAAAGKFKNLPNDFSTEPRDLPGSFFEFGSVENNQRCASRDAGRDL